MTTTTMMIRLFIATAAQEHPFRTYLNPCCPLLIILQYHARQQSARAFSYKRAHH